MTLSFFILIFLGLTILVKLVLFFLQSQKKSASLSEIPGPPPKFYFGNTLEMATNPLQVFLEYQRKYSPKLGFFKYFYFSDPVLVITDPELIKDVLNDHTTFEKDSDEVIIDVIGSGLLLANGNLWKKHRKLLSPSFGTEYMKFMVPAFIECTQVLIEKWKTYAQAGTVFDLHSEMTRLTLDVIGVAGFGYHFNAVKDPDGTVPRAVTTLLEETEKRIFSWVPTWKLPFTKGTQQFQAAKKTIQTILTEVIKNRMQEDVNEHSEDLLGRLLAAEHEGEKISASQLSDELMTFLIAGHETTATMLAFFFFIVSTKPEVSKQVYSEVDEILQSALPQYPDLATLKKIELAIKETMRLYPSVSMQTTRNLTRDISFKGFTIPRETGVEIWPWLLHRDPRLWENPEEFDLERFNRPIPPSQYLPFGFGSRACIGRHLALTESKVVISMLLQQFHFHLQVPSQEVEPQLMVTLRPANLKMKLSMRN